MKKLTQQQYIKKLSDKNINILPLEEYQGTHTKIKHKCECKNEWDVAPAKVLYGRKCPKCWEIRRNKITTEEYNLRLLNKGSTLVLKEGIEYKNKQKLPHVCNNCSRVMLVRTDNYGSCSHCVGRGWKKSTYKDRKTVLYYIKINNYYKIGLRILRSEDIEKEIHKRYSSEKIDITVLNYKVFDDGVDAYLLERNILKNNKLYRYNGEKFLNNGKGGGESEMYEKDIFEDIKENFE